MSKRNLTGKYLLLSLSVLFLTGISCQSKHQGKTQNDICGLATPMVFFSDTLTLNVQDYFVDTAVINEIIFPDEVIAQALKNKNEYSLVRKSDLPPLSVIKFKTSDGKVYSILLKNLKSEKAIISFDPGNKKYNEVKAKGTMNFWNLNLSKMKNAGGIWKEEFQLIPGEYQYVLVADGKEIIDSSNPDSVGNNIGGFNSLLKVGKYLQKDLPFLRTVDFDDSKINLECNEALTNAFAFWQNKRLKVKVRDRLVTVNIPDRIESYKRSYIRVFAYNQNGITNDILIPLEHGKVLDEIRYITRTDRQSMIMYFIMIDRFRNGSIENDEPVDDPEILPKANYFGGDLKGVLDVLREGYFMDLGVNTLWLSPITQNPTSAYGLYPKPHTKFSGYHGYWPISSIKIDYRFGTSHDFHTLVDETHHADMNIILDYVANHVHELHPVYLQHPEWATNLYLPDGTLNTEKWDEHRLTTWFDTFLPTLDLRKPEVVEPMTDSAVYWVREYGIDGFRHDATKHVDELYWRTLTKKLKEITSCNPMIYQIGETYGSPELIDSYISSGMLDGQFDFNVYDDAVAVFARDNESFERLKNSITQSLKYYGYHNLMGYITGNQDRPRFISLAGGSLRFDEDSKAAGWNREIGVGDPIAYQKLKLLHAFNLTIPGIPIIFYGDEIGLPGGNDPDNRRWMKFKDLTFEEKDVLKTVRKLTLLRTSSMALLYGDLQILKCDADVFAYIRTYFDQAVVVVFNKSREPKKVFIRHALINTDSEFEALFVSDFDLKNDGLEVTLEPMSFEIILN